MSSSDDKSGRSEERTDWLGNKYIQHYDSDGNKSGRSETKADWLGNEYVQHYDSDSNKAGRSEEKTDWIGNEYTQHYDSDCNKTGQSEDKEDWLGNEYVQHYDSDRDKVGRSEERADWLGNEYIQHFGGDGHQKIGRSSQSAENGYDEPEYAATDSGAATSYFDGDSDTGSSIGIVIFALFCFLGLAALIGLVGSGSSPSRAPSNVPANTAGLVAANQSAPVAEVIAPNQDTAATSPQPAPDTAIRYIRDIRPKLEEMGWQPVKLRNDDKCGWDTCPPIPELLFCGGTGSAPCIYTWKRGDAYLEVTALGEGEDQEFSSVRLCASITQSEPLSGDWKCLGLAAGEIRGYEFFEH